MALPKNGRKGRIHGKARGQVETLYMRSIVLVSTKLLHVKQCRFGKILWGKLPADVVGAGIGIEEFADLFFSDVQHVRIFNTEYVSRTHTTRTHTHTVYVLYTEHSIKRLSYFT